MADHTADHRPAADGPTPVPVLRPSRWRRAAYARRELAEETCQRASSWQALGRFWTAPGFTDELMHLYLARDLEPLADYVRASDHLPFPDASDERPPSVGGQPLAIPVTVLAAAGTICGMQKTTIYLEPELDRALDRLAAQTGRSKAETIRSALRRATQGVERPRIAAIGVAHGPGDVAEDVDRHLRETGFGEP